jgi:hypothetical protein
LRTWFQRGSRSAFVGHRRGAKWGAFPFLATPLCPARPGSLCNHGIPPNTTSDEWAVVQKPTDRLRHIPLNHLNPILREDRPAASGSIDDPPQTSAFSPQCRFILIAATFSSPLQPLLPAWRASRFHCISRPGGPLASPPEHIERGSICFSFFRVSRRMSRG